ncbi:hypothetical protein BpHYR1_031420 [Brachionus plicatilis]|uniref:Uncharacterized protein n=1 Tax=Brachionus plicatilis TaxID=10195 RepID=A0A3M7RH47_BRAPC|nr:hypothetical protein BpHYR1_031420 [Brachionus plicatilis]
MLQILHYGPLQFLRWIKTSAFSQSGSASEPWFRVLGKVYYFQFFDPMRTSEAPETDKSETEIELNQCYNLVLDHDGFSKL